MFGLVKLTQNPFNLIPKSWTTKPAERKCLRAATSENKTRMAFRKRRKTKTNKNKAS